jgi:nitrogen fixation protein FixH
MAVNLIARDRWIPWVFVGAFAVVFGANMAMVYFALSTWTGVTVERPYERGIAYDRVLDAAARQEALGWHVEVAFASRGAGTHAGTLAIAARDRDALALRGLAVTAELLRPLERHAPIGLALAEREGGHYDASLVVPRPGQWDVRVVLARGGDRLETTRRIFVP